MKSQMKMVAAAILAASLVGSYAYAGAPPAPAKKHATKKQPPKPTVEEQINALRQEFQGQIDGLKTDLATKDAAAEAGAAGSCRRAGRSQKAKPMRPPSSRRSLRMPPPSPRCRAR